MSTPLLYGLILATANILLTLFGYFLGYQTEKISTGAWFGFLPFLSSVIILWLGIRAVREENEKKALSYGRGVGTGMLIAASAAVLSSLYVYIHFAFINPNYADYLIEASRLKWAQVGMPEKSMEAAEKAIRMFTQPALQAVSTFVFSLISSLIISLITAAFLKQAPSTDPVNAT